MFPWEVGGWLLAYQERRCWELGSKVSNLCGPGPPTSRTDGQTDRQTDNMQSQYRALH